MVLPAPQDQGSRPLSDRDLDRSFAALADPTRRAVVSLLRERPMRAGELAEELDSAPALLSRHLRVLRESGLVAEQVVDGDARVRMYTLERSQFEQLRGWIEDVERYWTDQLHAFKAHAERTRGKPR